MDHRLIDINESEKALLVESIPILCLTHTDVEHRLFLDALGPLYDEGVLSGAILRYVDSATSQPYYLGRFGAEQIVYTKISHMGTTRPFGSLNTVNGALMTWRPRIVMMLGICAGLKKQHIGDVIIASELVNFEAGKVFRRRFLSRAYHYYPGNIYKLFDDVGTNQKNDRGDEYRIWKGSFLSGEKLVDSLPYKRLLLKYYPESDGLEMEGTGLGSACVNNGTYNWVMLKGVCDFAADKNAGGHKNENQELAMNNAIHAAMQVFSKGSACGRFGIPDNGVKTIMRNVMISTSYLATKEAQAEGLPVRTTDAVAFSRELAARLSAQGSRIITGVGEQTGNGVLTGIYDVVLSKGTMNGKIALSDYVMPYPFPRPDDGRVGGFSYEVFKNQYRELMAREAYACIFLFGIKKNDTNAPSVNADGVIEEYHIAIKQGKFVIPVGSTGFAAQAVWEEAREHLDDIYPIQSSKKSDDSSIDVRRNLRDACFNALSQTTDFSNREARERLIQAILIFMSQPWRNDQL